jgi:hypothetical protein
LPLPVPRPLPGAGLTRAGARARRHRFHLIVPLFDVAMEGALPLCARAQASGGLECVLGRAWPHYSALHDAMAAYERGREGLGAAVGAIRLLRKVRARAHAPARLGCASVPARTGAVFGRSGHGGTAR